MTARATRPSATEKKETTTMTGTVRTGRSGTPRQLARTTVAWTIALLVAALAAAPTASAAPADFDFASVGASQSTVQAGTYADSTTEFELAGNPALPDADGFASWANLKQVTVELPPGLIGNPAAFPTCSAAELTAIFAGFIFLEGDGVCPVDAQIGVADVNIWNFPPEHTPVFNMPSPGGDIVARIGFVAKIYPTILDIRVDPARGNALTATLVNAAAPANLQSSVVTLWGDPTDSSHDADRFSHLDRCDSPGPCVPGDPVPSGLPPTPFMWNPTSCTDAEVGFAAHSYQLPELTVTATAPFPTITGCESVPFEPAIDFEPTSREAGAPAGMDVRLSVPQEALSHPEAGLASAHLRKAVVTMPEGMTLNASAADGLGSCSEEQIGLTSVDPVRFDGSDPQCPDASKVGTAKVTTPVLDEPLEGSLYVAEQNDNPFGSLLAGYMVLRGPGVLIKQAGRFDLDPQTGQIVATFDDNPQQPFSEMELHFKGGPRGVLSMPSECGTYDIVSELTPWSGNPPVTLTSSFTVDEGCDAGGFDPDVDAGTTFPLGGEFSPMVARVQREDGEKELGRINMTLPRGLVGRLRGVALCTDEQIAAATGRSGLMSQTAPACPVGSQIGTTTVGAGSGSAPFYPMLPGTDASGRVFLTEAYTQTEHELLGAGDPRYGLAIEVPAVAGPFDLGTVLVRAAVYVDPVTAQLTVLSDQMPRILQGVVLNARDVRIDVDRDRFAINPTSCAQKAVKADIRAQDGTRALHSERFQVGGCGALGLRPRLAMRMVGRRQTGQGGHPALRALVRMPAGDANIRRARVALPLSLALDPRNANNEGLLCSYEDGQAASCPTSSIIGRVAARSPLLNEPLRGPVHFVQGVRFDPDTGNRIRTLPTLLIKLDGEIEVHLRARSTTSKGGRLISTFLTVPDAKVSRFAMRLRGGAAKGILTVTGRPELCDGPQRARFAVRGHNGKVARQTVRLRTPCTNNRRQLRLSRRSR